MKSQNMALSMERNLSIGGASHKLKATDEARIGRTVKLQRN